MSNNNPKMEKRLSWINTNNQEQVQWIEQFIKLKAVMLYQSLPFPLVHIFYQEGYVSKFMEYAKSWDEIAENREFCRNLKAAWNMWLKRKNDKKGVKGSYTISIHGRKKLESLAKKSGRSFSSVIERLITDADSIRKPANELNIELNEPIQINELIDHAEFIQKLESKDKELLSIQQDLESRDKELLSVQQDLESKDKELLSIKQKLENTEKELSSPKNTLELAEENFKISRKKLENNVNRDDKKNQKVKVMTISRGERSRLKNKKNV
jgi:hypothetical protein